MNLQHHIEIKHVINNINGNSFSVPVYFKGIVFNQIQFTYSFNERKTYFVTTYCASEYVMLKEYMLNLESTLEYKDVKFVVDIITIHIK